MNKKKKTIATASAVALAAILLFGGTMAYLYNESGKVTNTISADYNSVTLKESDVDGDGDVYSNTYDIVPGTSDTKDPVATVTYTLDSYVYIVMDETASNLVDFSIDTSVWTKLDGYTNVWYTLVKTTDADAATVANTNAESSTKIYTKSLNVLTDRIISYKSTLTNADMTNDDGNLISDVTIEFQAYIMQADPFSTGNTVESDGALAAYLAMLGDTSAYPNLGYSAMVNGKLYSSLSEAVSAALTGGANTTIELVADTEISEALVLSLNTGETASITLNLNGNSITYAGTDTSSIDNAEALIKVTDGVTLTITGDGTINGTAMDDSSTEHELIYVRGGNVVIESGTFLLDSTKGAVVCTRKTDDGEGSVVIYGGTFKNSASTYAYGTDPGLVLNQVNGNPGAITVYGGTFYGHNPADGDDYLNGNFVADGYRSVSVMGGVAYTVVEAETQTAVGTAAELTEALSALASNDVDTIVLAGDIDLTSAVSISSDVTIDGQGTATLSGYPVTVTADVTFKDVTLESPTNTSKNASLVYAYDGCESLVFDGVTFADPQWEAIQVTSNNITELSITNCTFTAANVSGSIASSYSGNTESDALRYIHVSCSQKPVIAITITGNDFQNCENVSEELFGIYKLGSGSTVTVGRNTFDVDRSTNDHLYNYDTSSSNSSPLKTLSTWTGTVQTVTNNF